MRLLVFKIALMVAALLAARYYLTKSRSAWRDRAIVVVLLLGLFVAAIDPQTTSWAARQLGIGRGVDLAFYVGFLLLFFLAAAQRVRLKDQQRIVSELVKEIALMRARPAPPAHPAEDRSHLS